MQRTDLADMFIEQNLILLGLVELGVEPRYLDFQRWLAEGKHADMNYLSQNAALRQDPRALLEGAQQAIIFAMIYGQNDSLSAARLGQYRVAQYARLRDYHKIMRRKGLAVLSELQQLNAGLEGRVMIDSAPLLERALASRTAHGFIGKNTCFILPKIGSFMLIGELFLNKTVIPSDVPSQVAADERTDSGGCGTCKRCQVFCPTGALDKAYSLDARLCLAYWTIEHRGTIPFEFWPWLPTYVFGCDLCQLACPYNRGVPSTRESIRRDLVNPDLFELAVLSQARYEIWMGGTPLTRAKREGLRRNALIALTVLKDQRLPLAIESINDDDAIVLHETVAQIKIWQLRQQCSDPV